MISSVVEAVRAQGSSAVPRVVHRSDFVRVARCFDHATPLLSWERLASDGRSVTCPLCLRSA